MDESREPGSYQIEMSSLDNRDDEIDQQVTKMTSNKHINSNNLILKKMEKKEKKIREERLKSDPERQKLVNRGENFLGEL